MGGQGGDDAGMMDGVTGGNVVVVIGSDWGNSKKSRCMRPLEDIGNEELEGEGERKVCTVYRSEVDPRLKVSASTRDKCFVADRREGREDKQTGRNG